MPHHDLRRPASSGFTLVEMIVSLAIMAILFIAILDLFDSAAKVTKKQNDTTDEQQAARYGLYQVAREVRMAGAGGLAMAGTSGKQAAVSMTRGSTTIDQSVKNNNVAAGTEISGHRVRPGTDMLHIRGVIANPVLDLAAGAFDKADLSNIKLEITTCSKYKIPGETGGICAGRGVNDLSAFNASSPPVKRIFMMSDAYGNVGVAMIKDGGVSKTGTYGTDTFKVTLQLDATSDTYIASLNPNYAAGIPPGLTTPVRGGILDDRIYFVSIGDPTHAAFQSGKCLSAVDSTNKDQVFNQRMTPGPCHPQLVVADWVAGGGATPFGNANVTPLAEEVENLQVTYGIDFYDLGSASGTMASPKPDGSLGICDATAINSLTLDTNKRLPDLMYDMGTADADEWFGNETSEGAKIDGTVNLANLKAINILLVVKSRNPDMNYKGPGAKKWDAEDSVGVAKTVSDDDGRAYLRREVSLQVALRNNFASK